jgi:hypothetical protein
VGSAELGTAETERPGDREREKECEWGGEEKTGKTEREGRGLKIFRHPRRDE